MGSQYSYGHFMASFSPCSLVVVVVVVVVAVVSNRQKISCFVYLSPAEIKVLFSFQLHLCPGLNARIV